ncbi:PTS fructose transporter subunit IIA [Curvibacter sp. APW13]|uniref:PTS sugar transporter subunit IIA n=1 Tax=Curvibacter sp. APW13 TaxID=3077236 RepID=UPI0028DF7D82|nr:PTS fructose transporter subunit IIA [Curvibacter sp. APW13]MDT8990628.1 PTS fructose transporter subunit IIA [Curvibacter sp. APW13]
MHTGLLIVAHSPLASALRSCVLHVYPDASDRVLALDVIADVPPDETLSQARALVASVNIEHMLVLTDVYGATPSNVAQRLVDGVHSRLVAGVNLPMLLRTVNYLDEDLDRLVNRAVAGGTQCVLAVPSSSPSPVDL